MLLRKIYRDSYILIIILREKKEVCIYSLFIICVSGGTNSKLCTLLGNIFK